MFELMFWPGVAALVLPVILVYYGLHIVRREVIFVDLALAQVAALGICVALLLKHEPHDWQTYAWSFAFTLIGAGLFALTRSASHHVPQEALIGIIYVVSAALGILMLNRNPHGNEELKEMLVGDLLLVQRPVQVWGPMALYGSIGVVHFLCRRTFLMLSFEPERAVSEGVRVGAWDFLFYALLGMVVTTFVHIGGVLMIFSYLIVPATCASFLVSGFRARFVVGVTVASLASLAGLAASVRFDWPTGAAVICALGLALAMSAGWWRLRRGVAT